MHTQYNHNLNGNNGIWMKKEPTIASSLLVFFSTDSYFRCCCCCSLDVVSCFCTSTVFVYVCVYFEHHFWCGELCYAFLLGAFLSVPSVQSYRISPSGIKVTYVAGNTLQHIRSINNLQFHGTFSFCISNTSL